MQLKLWLAAVMLIAVSMPIAAGNDEAWIENYMAQPGRSAGPAQIRRGYQIGWSELGRFTDVRVKVITDLGHVHRGYIERVDAERIELRAELYGGHAYLVLSRDKVRSTELE